MLKLTVEIDGWNRMVHFQGSLYFLNFQISTKVFHYKNNFKILSIVSIVFNYLKNEYKLLESEKKKFNLDRQIKLNHQF